MSSQLDRINFALCEVSNVDIEHWGETVLLDCRLHASGQSKPIRLIFRGCKDVKCEIDERFDTPPQPDFPIEVFMGENRITFLFQDITIHIAYEQVEVEEMGE
jgi:hypothetical protein